jgi:DNA modification methylase
METTYVGDATTVLETLQSHSVDMCLTSPPYWGQRQYSTKGIGMELTFDAYVESLGQVFAEVYRVLKPEGSLWLNLGDVYENKSLKLLPHRVAFHLIDQGWILRNDVIWHKVKGSPDSSKDKLRNVHEHLFHFVKAKKYYYNTAEIRKAPKKANSQRRVSASGVTGTRYKTQIETSALTCEEKAVAYATLEQHLQEISDGTLSDFRMVIRGQQRVTHSDSTTISGRARELQKKGFYFLRYHPEGPKMGDVWDIPPEDTHRRTGHFAAFPQELCRIPILATSPPNGVVLDPFCGTGTTLVAARDLGRNSIGIDISLEYINIAKQRLGFNPGTG